VGCVDLDPELGRWILKRPRLSIDLVSVSLLNFGTLFWNRTYSGDVVGERFDLVA
jgi:hypothetical protein